MKKSLKIFLIAVCSVFFVVFLVSGYKVYSIMHEYKVAENMYNDLNNQFVTTPPPTTPKPQTAHIGELEKEEEKKPESPINVDFDLLLQQWPDVKGWLYSEGTVINYPIAQDPNDVENEKYLYYFLDGTYNGSGTLFIDYRCAGDFSDELTIIYGHHMNDGSMLASITKYADQEYYNEHPCMYLNTPGQNYRLDIFSAFITDADGSTYNYNGFNSKDSYESYLDGVTRWSYIDTGVEVTGDDRIVIFSTCTYEYENARFVVLAKLVPLEPDAPAEAVK